MPSTSPRSLAPPCLPSLVSFCYIPPPLSHHVCALSRWQLTNNLTLVPTCTCRPNRPRKKDLLFFLTRESLFAYCLFSPLCFYVAPKFLLTKKIHSPLYVHSHSFLSCFAPVLCFLLGVQPNGSPRKLTLITRLSLLSLLPMSVCESVWVYISIWQTATPPPTHMTFSSGVLKAWGHHFFSMQDTLKPRNEPDAFTSVWLRLSSWVYKYTQPLIHTRAWHPRIHTAFSELQEHKLKAYKAAKANGKSWDCLVASQEEMREPAGDVSSSCWHVITQRQKSSVSFILDVLSTLKGQGVCKQRCLCNILRNSTLQPNNQLPFTRHRVHRSAAHVSWWWYIGWLRERKGRWAEVCAWWNRFRL